MRRFDGPIVSEPTEPLWRRLVPLLTGRSAAFISPYAPAECRDILKQSTDGFLGKKPVIAWYIGEWVCLMKRVNQQNSFRIALVMRLRPEGAGTRLAANIGMNPLAKVFAVLWFCFVGGAIVPDWLASQGVGLGTVALLASFAVLIIGIGRFMSRGEAAFLEHFLEQTLEAKATTS